MSAILLPFGTLLIVIAAAYICLATSLDWGIGYDRLFTGIGMAGACIILLGLFTLHP